MRVLAFFICVAVILVGLSAHADAPRVISFQGRLTNPSGVPQPGTLQMTLRLWDSETGGDMLGEDVNSSVVVDDEGMYSVDISIPGDVAFDIPVWLGVEVESDGEMSPRHRLTSSPYSFWAMDADKIDGKDASEFFGMSLPETLEASSPEPVLVINNTGTGPALQLGKAPTQNQLGPPIPKGIFSVGGNIYIHPDQGNVHGPGDLGVAGKANIGPGCTNAGFNAFVAGADNTADGQFSTIGGGSHNKTTLPFTSVGGGQGNKAENPFATVAGGRSNRASDTFASIGGGCRNAATGRYAAVGGGLDNTAGDYAAIGGGRNNNAVGDYTTVGGGKENTAKNWYATIGGGQANEASGDSSTVAGGANNTASGNSAAVGGGSHNQALTASSAIGGGSHNFAWGLFASIGGGERNSVGGKHGTVAGGRRNYAGFSSTVAGGDSNTASADYAAVLGGRDNEGTGDCSVILGGRDNKLTFNADYSMVYGKEVWLNTDRRIAFFDGDNWGHLGLNRDDANGGINHPIHVGTNSTNGNGAYLSADGKWTEGSSREFKENFQELDGSGILDKLQSLEVCRWHYKGSEGSHIGPIAEDFYDAFGTGTNNQYLASSDVSGVTMRAVQELIALLEAHEEAMNVQQDRIETLEAEIESVKSNR